MKKDLFLIAFLLALTSMLVAQTFDIRHFGARGDGKTTDTRAIQAAVDSAAAQGGGTVYFPAGRFRSGTIFLRSNIEIHLSPGAVWLGSDQLADYDTTYRHLIVAQNADNVALTGMGVIDGQGYAFYDTLLTDGSARAWTAKPRPEPWLLFDQCRRVRIRDIQLRHSPAHVLVFNRCDEVVVDGISVRCDLRSPNTDAIDLVDSRNVRIANCYLEAGDDLICLKSHNEWVEYVTVTNCVLISDDAAIKFGTASYQGVRNCVFSNLTIYNTRYGIALFMIDGGTYEHCLFDNIAIRTGSRWSNEYPVFIDIHRRTPSSPIGRIKDIQLRNLTIQTQGNLLIAGQAGQPLEDIWLDGLNITLTGCNDLSQYAQKPRGSKTLVPDPELADYCRIPAHLAMAHIRGLRLRNVQLRQARKLDTCDRNTLWLKDVQESLMETPGVAPGLTNTVVRQ